MNGTSMVGDAVRKEFPDCIAYEINPDVSDDLIATVTVRLFFSTSFKIERNQPACSRLCDAVRLSWRAYASHDAFLARSMPEIQRVVLSFEEAPSDLTAE